jgi:hypothetical protein
MGSGAQIIAKQGLIKVAVVIPIYKDFDELTKNEKRVLMQIKVILSARDLFIVHPGRVNITPFHDFLAPCKLSVWSSAKSFSEMSTAVINLA